MAICFYILSDNKTFFPILVKTGSFKSVVNMVMLYQKSHKCTTVHDSNNYRRKEIHSECPVRFVEKPAIQTDHHGPLSICIYKGSGGLKWCWDIYIPLFYIHKYQTYPHSRISLLYSTTTHSCTWLNYPWLLLQSHVCFTNKYAYIIIDTISFIASFIIYFCPTLFWSPHQHTIKKVSLCTPKANAVTALFSPLFYLEIIPLL